MSADLSTLTGPNTKHLQTVSLREAGALLGMGRTTVYKHNRHGTFPVPVLDIVGNKRVRLVDLEAYLESLAS